MKKFIFVLLLFPMGLLAQTTLSVKIHNVASSEGAVNVAVYNSDETFLKFEGVVKSGSTKAKKGVVTLEIEEIPEGEYALAIFHDENGNNELDTNWLGIPKEKVAFSKSKMKTFGPPKYKECAFLVEKDTKVDVYF
ncbi:DUF2141 domain-containing protein [Flagellimonas allohymeniacidonis]|uniref:DUF2141 domain-containing protein n=1 Tax=Flagellimonas allohymeniacidonis TaxID=2517819 RepID=A0A4Q8QCF4_9FLAO|nr:DUF2141 domain-containing protein [Allomuricauda hymeniacidonis]TAI47354.1 DUF2141 domain-containing protein [Allomuricauda hymeniacidonis]